MSHGFDDSGATFDGDGNLVNWWSDADLKNFKDATTKLAKQFSQYEPVKGTHINGEFTNGENIGDLGGVNVAYDALQMYLKDKGNPEKSADLHKASEILYVMGNCMENIDDRESYNQSD